MKSSGSMLKTHKSQSSNGPTGPESDDNFPLFSPEFGSGAFQLDSWSTSQAVKPSQADFLLKELGQFIGIKLSTHGVRPGFRKKKQWIRVPPYPPQKFNSKLFPEKRNGGKGRRLDQFFAPFLLGIFSGNFSGAIC